MENQDYILASKNAGGEKQAAEINQWADFAGSLTASIAGGIVYAVASRYQIAPLAKFGYAALSGMAARPTAKSGVEHAFLPPEQHTTNAVDCAWGAIDGLSGIFGAAAESKVGTALSQRIGACALGRPVSASIAQEAGKRVIANSVGYRLTAGATRGIAGGAAGSAAFSVPHSLVEHGEEIRADPLYGLIQTAKQVSLETAMGALFCGGLGTAGSAFVGRREIFSKIQGALSRQSDLTELRILHFNDLHSNLLGDNSLSRLGGKVEALRTASKPGRTVHLYSVGDEYSGNVISNYTNNGELENQAIAKLKPTAMTPGNHAVDRAGQKASIQDWVKINEEIATASSGASGSKLVSPVIAANVEVKIPGYESFIGKDGIVQPYRIVPVEGKNGKLSRVGLIGLVTHELEAPDVIVTDHIKAARCSVAALKEQGVDNIVVLSHLGFGVDNELAKNVEGLSAIVGGHSHDPTPVPHWVAHDKSGRLVPIVQAGSEGKWLGDLELVFDKNGSANRFHTKGKLHAIDATVEEHPGIKNLIEASPMARAVEALEQSTEYSRHVLPHSFSAGGIRYQETALGNLVSDAMMSGMNEELVRRGEAPIQAFLKHSGDIRKGLPEGRPITGWTLSDVFCNGENTRELCVANMNGQQIKDALEFSLGDMAGELPQKNLAARSGALVKEMILDIPRQSVDHSGNFLQVSGMRYAFDLAKPKGQRLSHLSIWSPTRRAFEAVHGEQSYKVGTLLHPIDKWAKAGIFEGPRFNEVKQEIIAHTAGLDGKEAGKAAAHKMLNSEAIGLSQPKLLDRYLADSEKIAASARTGNRIVDLTPRPWRTSYFAIGSNAGQNLDRNNWQ